MRKCKQAQMQELFKNTVIIILSLHKVTSQITTKWNLLRQISIQFAELKLADLDPLQ
jgi:hypothetical protein